jgi:cysteine desulfurase
MLPYFTEFFGNPSSSLHQLGRKAADAIERARSQVAELIGAKPGEIVFTSGASESNNLAIFGVAETYSGKRKRIVTTPIEHKAVLEPFRQLTRRGFETVFLPVDSRGRVDLVAAEQMIDDQTLLVSVQAANNEIGTIQPLPEIVALAHRCGALVHCDAAQAVGKIPLDVGSWGVDLLSISAHKLYGPKGIGALYVNQRVRKASTHPQIFGGGQESGLRSGTQNVPGIVGLGEACEIARVSMAEESWRVSRLRDAFESGLRAVIPGIHVNGDLKNRLPGNSSITFPNIEADALILNMPDVALSVGSACNSGAIEPSYVLTSIGLSRELAHATVRIGWGRFNEEDDVTATLARVSEAYSRLVTLT